MESRGGGKDDVPRDAADRIVVGMNNRLRSAALLLALAGAIPGPGSAQGGRQMAAFVSPNVTCRVAPSPSAEVAGFLRPLDGLRGSVIESVERTETDDAGEVWVHVGPAYTKRARMWARMSDGCWVHESVLAPTDGYVLTETHLLLIADGLLSAPEGRTLPDLLAAHNVFTHTRYREMVAQSPVLDTRRRDLLARALRVVEAEGLAERDPLVVAWLESLGEEAGNALLAGDAGQSGDARETVPPGARELAIIAPDVACRSAPAADGSLRGATLRLDHHFVAERADTTVAGEDWTFVFDGCWVRASLTAPTDNDEHVPAIAARFASASEGRSTGNLLWVYNVLSGRNTGYRDVVDASAILSLRRLELIQRWLGTVDAFTADPLTWALVQSLEDEVAYFEPGGMWTLRDDALLNLYERHRGQPEAHEILWRLVMSPAYNDCEGIFSCHARASVLNRLARYWVAYPDGPRVAEAVTRARDRLQWVLQGCRAARDAAPGSRESRWREAVRWEQTGAETARELRASLSEVASENKAPLVELLDALEACAEG